MNQISLEGGGPGLGGTLADFSYSDPQYIQKFYECLKTIIYFVPQCIVDYENMIFDTIEQVILTQHQHASEVIDLLVFINVMTNKYLPQMNFILPKVLHLIDSKNRSDSS